jgi:hypothetical protein
MSDLTPSAGRPPLMIEPGKYIISNEEYHADPYYFSSSQLKEALKSPLHFKYYVVNRHGKKKSTKSQDLGTLIHAAVLEPWKLDEEYLVYQGELTPTGLIPKYAETAYKKSHPGRIIITPEQYEFATKARESLRDYGSAGGMLFDSECAYEVSYFIQCEETGLKFRVRPDCINVEKGYVIDLKTTSTTSKHEFKRHVSYSFDYDMSAFMYLKVLSQFHGKTFDWYWVTVGTEELCPVAIYKMSEATLQDGKAKFYKAVDAINSAIALPNDTRFQNGMEEL